MTNPQVEAKRQERASETRRRNGASETARRNRLLRDLRTKIQSRTDDPRATTRPETMVLPRHVTELVEKVRELSDAVRKRVNSELLACMANLVEEINASNGCNLLPLNAELSRGMARFKDLLRAVSAPNTAAFLDRESIDYSIVLHKDEWNEWIRQQDAFRQLGFYFWVYSCLQAQGQEILNNGWETVESMDDSPASAQRSPGNSGAPQNSVLSDLEINAGGYQTPNRMIRKPESPVELGPFKRPSNPLYRCRSPTLLSSVFRSIPHLAAVMDAVEHLYFVLEDMKRYLVRFEPQNDFLSFRLFFRVCFIEFDSVLSGQIPRWMTRGNAWLNLHEFWIPVNDINRLVDQDGIGDVLIKKALDLSVQEYVLMLHEAAWIHGTITDTLTGISDELIPQLMEERKEFANKLNSGRPIPPPVTNQSPRIPKVQPGIVEREILDTSSGSSIELSQEIKLKFPEYRETIEGLIDSHGFLKRSLADWPSSETELVRFYVRGSTRFWGCHFWLSNLEIVKSGLRGDSIRVFDFLKSDVLKTLVVASRILTKARLLLDHEPEEGSKENTSPLYDSLGHIKAQCGPSPPASPSSSEGPEVWEELSSFAAVDELFFSIGPCPLESPPWPPTLETVTPRVNSTTQCDEYEIAAALPPPGLQRRFEATNKRENSHGNKRILDVQPSPLDAWTQTERYGPDGALAHALCLTACDPKLMKDLRDLVDRSDGENLEIPSDFLLAVNPVGLKRLIDFLENRISRFRISQGRAPLVTRGQWNSPDSRSSIGVLRSSGSASHLVSSAYDLASSFGLSPACAISKNSLQGDTDPYRALFFACAYWPIRLAMNSGIVPKQWLNRSSMEAHKNWIKEKFMEFSAGSLGWAAYEVRMWLDRGFELVEDGNGGVVWKKGSDVVPASAVHRAVCNPRKPVLIERELPFQ